MQFEDSKVVLFHGVVDLRKGAAGLVALVDDSEPHTWYLFSNRSRTLIEVRASGSLRRMDGFAPLKARALPLGRA